MTTRRMNEAKDRYYMSLAIDLARRGTGRTAPNPRVGCVIVKEDHIAGWGFHKAFGLPHAEAEALQRAGDAAKGSTLYVNLEPCSHYGKTPPCSGAIIKAGVSRVVAAMKDPDPRVSGRGFRMLREAGIDVDVGPCATEAAQINRGFIKRMIEGRPWVTLKAAMTLDGRIADESGWSKWISNEWSRKRAHILRTEHDAVLVGIGTVASDDPKLTVREVSGYSPRVVLLDPSLKVSPGANIFRYGKPLVIASTRADSRKVRVLENAGAGVILLPSEKGSPALSDVLGCLADEGINELLVEGGSKVLGSFLSERLFDDVSLFVSPRFMGEGKPLCGEVRWLALENAPSVFITKKTLVEGDLWIEGTVKCSLD